MYYAAQNDPGRSLLFENGHAAAIDVHHADSYSYVTITSLPHMRSAAIAALYIVLINYFSLILLLYSKAACLKRCFFSAGVL